jgi:hypothetical protein
MHFPIAADNGLASVRKPNRRIPSGNWFVASVGFVFFLFSLPVESFSQANLMPYPPAGWSDKIIVSRTPGTTTDSTNLTTNDTLYVDWAVVNNGTTATAIGFDITLFVDGVFANYWYVAPPMNAKTYQYFPDYSIGKLSAGTHTLTIWADAYGVVAESSKADNQYTKTITVLPYPGNMAYHGGPVQHGQKVYTIFWAPPGTSFPDGYQTTINQFVQDLNGSPYYAIASQYGDSAGGNTLVSLGGTWLDTSNALPSPPPYAAISDEVARATTAKGWTVDDNSLFLVYTPSNITTDAYCAYHSVTTSHVIHGLILFPEVESSKGTCLLTSSPWPNGQSVDNAISATAHEIVETVTDPYPNSGWLYINGAGEIGDLCFSQYGSRDSSGADLQLNGHKYLVQMLWSNADNGCAMSLGGFVSSAAVSLSGNILAFGNQAIGASSVINSVVVTNTGGSALTIASISITGSNTSDFVQTNNCGGAVAAGASCSISVVFTPGAIGVRSASLAISDSAPGSPHSVTLTGTAVAPTSSAASATANTYHVFPQFADGKLSAGDYYRTTLMISNLSSTGDANCVLQLHGLTAPAFNLTYTLGPAGWVIAQTSGAQNFQSGYATLQCSANVEAQLLYSYYSPSGSKISEAAVFSSSPAGSVEILADEREGAAVGLAIANDTDRTTAYTITAGDANGNILASTPITIPARTSVAKFVDELVSLPANYYGPMIVSSSTGTASIIGLRFRGAAFTTIPETIR